MNICKRCSGGHIIGCKCSECIGYAAKCLSEDQRGETKVKELTWEGPKVTKKAKSPTNTYMAMCNKADFSGFYFKKFEIPEQEVCDDLSPSWYFLNRVDFVSCLEEVLTIEDFQSGVREVIK